MKKAMLIAGVAVAVIIGTITTVVNTGCVTSKQTTVTGGVTNTVVVVNTNNLIIDASVLKGVTATSVALVLGNGNNPSLIQPLKDAQHALDGILDGVTTNDVNFVIGTLKAQDNKALTLEINDLMQLVSSLEQKYLAQGVSQDTVVYVTSVFVRAVDDGLSLALQGR